MKHQIFITDAIGGWFSSLTANSIKSQLSKVKENDEVEVLINSPGGNVFEGIAIFNLLKDYKPTVRIIGLAGSIASVIACAGEKIIMNRGAQYFIHPPWNFSGGDSTYKRKVADDLDRVKSAIVEAYQYKISKTEKQIFDLMDEDRHFTSKESKELGLANEIASDEGTPVYANLYDAMTKYVALIKDNDNDNENNSGRLGYEDLSKGGLDDYGWRNQPNNKAKENLNNSTNKEESEMDPKETTQNSGGSQETIQDVKAELNKANAQIVNLEKEKNNLEAEKTRLENEKKDLSLKLLENKKAEIEREEEAFLQKLVENKQLTEQEKNYYKDDLVNKRLDTDKSSYQNLKNLLQNKEVNPLTQSQATTQNKGAGSGVTGLTKADFDDGTEESLVAVNNRMKEKNISFEDAMSELYAEVRGGNDNG